MQNRATSNGLRRYLIGLVLALMLTAIPFSLVAWSSLDRQGVVALIALTALLQAAVHLYFFLGIDSPSTPRESLLALTFAIVLMVIMIGGSLWIAMDLHNRMAITSP